VKRHIILSVFLLVISLPAQASIFGEENAPLWKLVTGQIIELDRLAQAVGVAEEQRDILIQLNEGVERTTRQIEALESVIERAKGLDPSSVRTLSDLTSRIESMKSILVETSEVVSLKIQLCDQAISQSAVQSDTAYKMGQEMISAGSSLAQESRSASPGRAGQISAAASSSQMLATGVQLQTLAHMAQLQAMSLELQKVQIQKEVRADQSRREFVTQQLSGKGRLR